MLRVYAVIKLYDIDPFEGYIRIEEFILPAEVKS